MSEQVNDQITDEQKLPSKEEVMAFLLEQIDVKKLQVELQELNARFAKAKAEELQAVQFAANMTNPQNPAQPHTITQQDMDQNPELAEQGFKVGDEVMVAQQPVAPEQKSRNLKK